MLTRKFHSTHPLALGFAVSIAVTVTSYILPIDNSASTIGLLFLLSTYALALSRRVALPPAEFGLALGGLMETTPLSLKRILRETARAIGIATAVALLVLPPFWLGFELWYQPATDWSLERALTPDAVAEGASLPAISYLWDLSLGHLLIVALPEEAFFRGYLQSALDRRWKKRLRLLGTEVSASLFVVSLLFAFGHLATTGGLGRLAVFFPSLLFGYLRVRTGGIGASVILHAQCNVFAALLGKGFGLY